MRLTWYVHHTVGCSCILRSQRIGWILSIDRQNIRAPRRGWVSGLWYKVNVAGKGRGWRWGVHLLHSKGTRSFKVFGTLGLFTFFFAAEDEVGPVNTSISWAIRNFAGQNTYQLTNRPHLTQTRWLCIRRHRNGSCRCGRSGSRIRAVPSCSLSCCCVFLRKFVCLLSCGFEFFLGHDPGDRLHQWTVRR